LESTLLAVEALNLRVEINIRIWVAATGEQIFGPNDTNFSGAEQSNGSYAASIRILYLQQPELGANDQSSSGSPSVNPHVQPSLVTEKSLAEWKARR
jgi:hypothetical protein